MSMDAENLMSRDPSTGLRITRDHKQPLTRLEWYTELMTGWVYQREIADNKSHMASFEVAAHALKHAIEVLEHSYSYEELYGVDIRGRAFYRTEINGIRIDKSTDAATKDDFSIPDATGQSSEE